MRLLSIGLISIALLTGCHAPTNPTLESASSTSSLQASTLRTVPEAQVRRILNTSGSASLWGINYSQSFRGGNGTNKVYVTNPNSGRRYKIRKRWEYSDYTGNANFSGKAALNKAAYNRYIYQVPSNQVLVINQIEGVGAIYLNGFVVGVNRYESGTQKSIHYVFGPGETVVISMSPGVANSGSRSGNTYYHKWIQYHGLSVSGFTASPELFGGMSSFAGNSGK